MNQGPGCGAIWVDEKFQFMITQCIIKVEYVKKEKEKQKGNFRGHM